MFQKLLLVLFSACLSSVLCQAQANDIGISVGGVFSPNSPAVVNVVCPIGLVCTGIGSAKSAVAIEGTLAHRLVNLHLVSLHLELPVVGTPNRTLTGGSYSSVFFTPGLRVKFSLPVISPFLSAGGGFAHFSTGANINNTNSTTGAFQVGGGFDVGTPIPLLSLRGEVREFYTGTPSFTSTQHNVFVGGGIVLNF